MIGAVVGAWQGFWIAYVGIPAFIVTLAGMLIFRGLALITLGEGWHNNHHRSPNSTRQGFLPHEIDPTYWILKLLEKFHLVWDLRPVPEAVLQEARSNPSVRHER